MALNNFTGNNGNTNVPPGGGNTGGNIGGTGIPGGPGGIGGVPGGAGSLFSGGSSIDPLDLLIDYNQKFAMAGPTLFRDDVVHQVLAVLIGKNKPNAILIGPAGVGKTRVVEDIAYRIVNNDPVIPDKLKNSTIYELPLSNIVAGSSFVGQVEEKIKAVMEFLHDPANHAIVFIDEIHQLSGESQTYEKIAQIMKPYLARGDIKTIGATTLQEAANLMDDPALNRRFTRVVVDEFTQEQTIEILLHARAGFMKHYANKITIDDSVLSSVVYLADEYRPAGSHRPDNAITLLDRAIGDAIVARKVMEQNAQNDPMLLQAIQSMPLIPITEKQVRKTAVNIMTGNAKKNDFDIDAMRAALSSIKGQDDIIEKVLAELRRYDLNLFPRTTPLTFLFAGTSGVGKTEITKIIANELTGVKPITLNMTEYHSSASINRIIGSPAGYVGSESHAELPFDCLESNPYQIILLDEFEKGDKAVQRLFMSAFDEGYIKTNRGKTVDFSRAIIIATTNAAHVERKRKLGFATEDEQPTKSETVKDLSAWFDTELLNRFNSILTFHELDKDIYRDILNSIYHTEVARIRAEKPRIQLLDDIPDDDIERIIKDTYVPAFGARPAKKAVREFIESQV